MSTSQRLRSIAQNLPSDRLKSVLIRTIRSLLQYTDSARYKLWELFSTRIRRLPSDGALLSILKRMGIQGLSEYIVWQKIHAHDRTFIPINRASCIDQIKSEHPDQITNIINLADTICQGTFDLLGSGPVDMRRSKRCAGYQLDWARDPITGFRYKRFFDFRRWHHSDVKTGQPDVKGCWELGRFQHFPTLGQAYWLTGEQKYADCFAHSVTDFIKRNPTGVGVQWACPMDVGLRVVSWIIGVQFFQGNKALSYRWWKRFIKSLVAHGQFIASNLEFGTLNHDIITSNHYLSDIFGLYYLALAFPNIDVGCVWRGLAERALEHEIKYQSHEDGGNFESSLPYHSLVTEIFLSAYALSLKHNVPLSDNYLQQLLKALNLLKATRQPCGRQPQIGDADMGRAHIFSNYGQFTQENTDTLLAAGAHVLNCPELAEDVPQQVKIETLFWHSQTETAHTIESIEDHCLLKETGLAVARNQAAYVLLSNTPAGTLGISNHKHNDHLSIEYNYKNQPVLVDPGSCTYTQDPTLRNQFRSTAMHSTLQIGKHEQNTFDPSLLFKMNTEAQTTLECIDNKLVGTHTGYERLEPSCIHTREVELLMNGELIITDKLSAKPAEPIRLYFILHPDIEPGLENNTPILKTDVFTLCVNNSSVSEWSIESTFYSPQYGVKQPTFKLVGKLDINKNDELITSIQPKILS